MSKKFAGGSATATKFGKSLTALTTPAGVAVTAIGGLAIATNALVKATAEYADNVGKASQRMNVSIEFYQKMASASAHAGTSMTTMETGMRTMLRTMAQVEDGNKRMASTYAEIGVALKDNEGN